MSGASIEMDEVAFSYPTLNMQFRFHARPGDFVALIGPSGSGKSTFLNLIAGFETPASGSIVINGRDVTGLPPAQREISFIFQDNNLFSHLSARRNVALGLSASSRLSSTQWEVVMQALDRVGLAGLAARRPKELSGGECQRVALARALVRKKPLLLLDEPFVGLGPALREDMLSMISEIRRETGSTVILVSHSPDDAKRAASHTSFVKDGHIILHGRTQKVFATDNRAFQDYLGGLQWS